MGKKVLVIGTSPRLHGNSNILAQAFAEGAEASGNDVEFIPLAGKKIGFCVGCWACLKTQRCVFHDDADIVVQKMKNADVVVFATPIYYYEMSGQMKTLLDRTNCLYTADYKFRQIYLLTSAEATAPETPEHAVGGLKGWLKVFRKAHLAGTVFAGGTTEDGTIKGHPEIEEAKRMGTEV
jgi:multimeric flavodoxin WrbA